MAASPRLEISIERINPGGIVEVRGVDFEAEELVTFALIGHEFEFPLGEIATGMDGIFLQFVPLPAGLPEGEYNFRAVTDDHEVISPTLTVFGAAMIEDEGGEGIRGEEDGLFAPMPTYAPDVVPGGVVQAVAPQPSAPEAPASNRNTILFVLLALAAGILAVFGIRVARRR